MCGVMEASVTIDKAGRQDEADVNQKLASFACVPAVASKEMILSWASSVDSTPVATASKPLNDHQTQTHTHLTKPPRCLSLLLCA